MSSINQGTRILDDIESMVRDSSAEWVKLKVEKNPVSNSMRGYVGIYEETAAQLNVSNDDYLEIVGVNTTFARVKILSNPNNVMPLRGLGPSNIIQMDNVVVENALSLSFNQFSMVSVRKWIPKYCKRVFLAFQTNSNENEAINEKVLKKILLNRVLNKGDIITLNSYERNLVVQGSQGAQFYGSEMKILVIYVECEGAVRSNAGVLDDRTDLILRKNPIFNLDSINTEKIYIEDVGGYNKEKSELKDLLALRVYQADILQKSKFAFSNGIILIGESGIGKTLLAKALVNEFPVAYFYVNAPTLIGDKPQSCPSELEGIFKEAIDCQPSIIVIDEVEALASRREDMRFDAIMRNICTQFLHTMDMVKGTNVVVIATTSRYNMIDESLFSANRFGKQIRLKAPSEKDREEILHILAKKSPLIDEKILDIKRIAAMTNGFTGADLNNLVQEAVLEKIRRLPNYKEFLERTMDFRSNLKNLKITTEVVTDLLKEKKVRPSLLNTYFVETPKVRFSDIGGLSETKKMLEELVIFPFRYPDLYKRLGGKSTKGLLLYGPPGCGKTLIAKALARESNMNFISIKGAEVLKHWLGESEATVRDIFAKARAAAPCIIFFDELDAISMERGELGNVHSDRVTAQILTEIDGLEESKDVICIGATNRLDVVDEAISRPGRLYPLVKIDLPDEAARVDIIKIHTREKPVDPQVDLAQLAKKAEGMSGAALEELCNLAAIYAIREAIKDYESLKAENKAEQFVPEKYTIKNKHFNEAFIVITKKLKEEKELGLYC